MGKIAGIVIAVLVIAGAVYWYMSNSDSSQYIEVDRDLAEDSEGEHEETGLEHGHEIVHTDSGFSPKTLTVEVGEEVIFKNEASGNMWPASNSHPTHLIYPEFDAKKAIAPEGTFEFKFTKEGTWAYHDHMDPAHQGTIVVK